MNSPFSSLKILKFCSFSCKGNRALHQNQKVAYWDFQNPSGEAVKGLKTVQYLKY